MALVFVYSYVGFFAVGMGPIPWVVNSEIYPVSFIQLHLRSIANSMSTTANWISNFVVSATFLSLTSFPVGEILAWGLIGSFAVLTWLWVFYLLPETKGLELDATLKLFDCKIYTDIEIKK